MNKSVPDAAKPGLVTKHAQVHAPIPRELSEPVSTLSARALSDLVTVELTIDGRNVRTVPIPARKRQIREVDVGNGTTLSVELSSYQNEFIELAERNASRVGKPADHVPFKAYWSSYGDMDKAQSGWYYYWRNEVRNGRYPPTDLSYIFIHVYECLHGIGFDTILHAYGHLWALWHNYRQQHPRLDNYLMSWMLDLNAYYEIGMDSLEIVRSSVGAVTSGISSDLFTASIVASEPDDEPTISQIALIAKFDPRSGKFYREFSDTGLIDRTLQLGFKALDDYFRDTANVGVIKAHEPKRKVKVLHPAFAGAVFGYETKQLLIAEVSAYSGVVKLPKLIEDTLKLSENILRKQVSFAGQRRGIELPLAIEERIRSILGDTSSRPAERRSERRVLTIDPSLTELLKAESVEIRAALIASMQSRSKAVAHSARFELPSNLHPNDLTDVDEVASVLDKLSVTDLGLIRSLWSADWEIETDGVRQIEEVNRHALADLGEPLLLIEADRLLVADDYRDEVSFLLSLPEFSRVETLKTKDHPGVPTGWSSLRSAMSAVQAAAVKLIVEGVSSSDFDAFAFDHAAMSALLLDEINELALHHVGDTLVSKEDGSVVVFEDYLDDARLLFEA